jgi:F0F1-type ATP synthase epsilon subunit
MIQNIKQKVLLSIGLLAMGLLIQNNVFSQSTVDLSTRVTDNAPSGSVLEWHNLATPSIGSKLTVAQIAAAPAGSYYAVYFNAVSNCYSPTSQITIATNTCPVSTVDLNAGFTGTTPSGSSLVWYTNNTASGSAYATPATATAGTYYAYYFNAASNCFSPPSAPVVVTIQSCVSITPVAENGIAPATGGTAVTDVRSNDLINGGVATSSNSTISQLGTWPSGITLNTTTGAITVANGTAPGVYAVTYQLCDLTTPTANCATVVDNITVTEVINPVTENGTAPATGGVAVANVRANDLVNGVAATSSNSTISQSGIWATGITLNTTTGAITVANGTTPGVYALTYQLCDLATPTANCATVVNNITVTAPPCSAGTVAPILIKN